MIIILEIIAVEIAIPGIATPGIARLARDRTGWRQRRLHRHRRAAAGL